MSYFVLVSALYCMLFIWLAKVKLKYKIHLILLILLLLQCAAFYYFYTDYIDRILSHGMDFREFTNNDIYNWKIIINYYIFINIVFFAAVLLLEKFSSLKTKAMKNIHLSCRLLAFIGLFFLSLLLFTLFRLEFWNLV